MECIFAPKRYTANRTELDMAVEWTAEGDLFEGCNCNLLCPCHVSFRQPPTMGYCDTIWAVSIDQGRYGDVDLKGLKAAIFLHCPGNMADGDWTTAQPSPSHRRSSICGRRNARRNSEIFWTSKIDSSQISQEGPEPGGIQGGAGSYYSIRKAG